MNIQTVKNVSDCVPLYLPHSLYLKPHAKLVISVQLPTTVTGKSISNWDVMENLRNIILPDKFSVLKVTKSTLELTRLDAELDDRERLKPVVARLDGNSIKLNGFNEPARIRAAETKDNFPKRHDWDSYFRDARNMDEKKCGERPDTIHISNLPIRWFCPRHMENEDAVKPSESIFKRIFEKFGSVRVVDIPICDPYRKDMKSHMTGMKTFSFDQELYFEGYVQFSEYIGFVRTMDALRGMKLLHKEGDKNLAINIAVDFDTTKHLSEASIKRRQVIRDRLIMKENEKREEERRKAAEEELKKQKEREKLEQTKIEEYEKQRQREEKRKEKHLKKIREQEQQQLDSKIRSEEKKLLIAQRKLESIRVLEALFDRIKLKNETIKAKIKIERNESGARSHHSSTSSSRKLKTFDLRNKLITKVKSATEVELERQKSRLKKYKSGIIVKRDSSKERSPSVNSISSGESILSDKPVSKKKRKKTEDSDRSANEEESEHTPLVPGMSAYPMYNPETGQWLGMYPYPPPFFPTMYPPAAMPYSNNFGEMPRGGYRGRYPRSRGRRIYRGRVNNYGHDDRRNDDWYDHKRRRDHRRRSGSNSRDSRSRSRSYSSRDRSYSRGRRGRKSRSRSKSKSRSRSRSRTKLQEEHKSKKLASTLRRSHSSSSSSYASRRSNSRSRKHSRSSRSRHRSRESRDKNSSTRSKRAKSINSNSEKKKRAATRTPSPRKKSSERDRAHTPPSKRSPSPPKPARDRSKSRSASVDSAAFQSPKRRPRSVTPEKEWD